LDLLWQVALALHRLLLAMWQLFQAKSVVFSFQQDYVTFSLPLLGFLFVLTKLMFSFAELCSLCISFLVSALAPSLAWVSDPF
jgi:hypothetical protein